MKSTQALVSDDASWVSRKCWSDAEVYQREKAAIFGRNWLFLGHETQISAPGDFVQAYMGETPIILARDEAGDITACVNSCSHRGLPVCRADHGNARRFVCPYHNWSYTVGGDLVTIPQEKALAQQPDKSLLGLKRVPRVESWQGMIFGCFDPDIMPLDAYLGDMRFYLDAFFERFEGGVEFIVADALRSEFLRRRAVDLVEDPSQADLVLEGRVLPIRAVARSFSSVVLSLEYELTLELDLHAVRRDGSEVALDARVLRESERYLASADPEVLRKNREEAVRRVAQLLAERVYDALYLSLAP